VDEKNEKYAAQVELKGSRRWRARSAEAFESHVFLSLSLGAGHFWGAFNEEGEERRRIRRKTSRGLGGLGLWGPLAVSHLGPSSR